MRSALILCLLVVATPIAPADGGRIADVTVFRDRAEVVRERSVQLGAGASTVSFSGLPAAIDAGSVRVTAEGAPASLGAIEIVPVVPEDPEQPNPELEAVQAEIKRLEREIAAMHAAERADNQLRNYLQALGKATAESQAERLPEATADPAVFRSAFELMSVELHRLGEGSVERTFKRQQLERELERARARASVLRPERAIVTHTVNVGIESPRGGRLTVRLAYLLPGASWQPAYRATLADDGRVELIYEGVVRQTTGEDWEGARLSLSSASPTQRIAPPRLSPWELRRAEEIQVVRHRTPGAFSSFQNTVALAPGEADAAEEVSAMEDTAAAPMLATVARSAYAVTFDVPGRSDVASDGRDHRVTLTSRTLESNPVHRTVPSQQARAYLTAVTNAPADLPLLTGRMQLFAGENYLGTHVVEESAPGLELTLPFGVDNRVEIVRVPLPRPTESADSAGRTREVQRAYKTEITNRLDRPITIVVEERHPVTNLADVDIELIERETTEGHKPSARRPGVLLWTLELAAGEKRDLKMAFRVRHPSSMPLAGL